MENSFFSEFGIRWSRNYEFWYFFICMDEPRVFSQLYDDLPFEHLLPKCNTVINCLQLFDISFFHKCGDHSENFILKGEYSNMEIDSSKIIYAGCPHHQTFVDLHSVALKEIQYTGQLLCSFCSILLPSLYFFLLFRRKFLFFCLTHYLL